MEGGTLGLPLNWSWMHKPSVFLAVCQCERGGGSCRSGPGLNDGARNLCFRSATALWAPTRPRSRCPVRWNKVEDALPVRSPPVHPAARAAEWEKWEWKWKWTCKMTERGWKRENALRWTEGMWWELQRKSKVCGCWEHCAGEWGSGPLCARQSVAQWVRLSGAWAKDEGQERKRWGQPAGCRVWRHEEEGGGGRRREDCGEQKQKCRKLSIYFNFLFQIWKEAAGDGIGHNLHLLESVCLSRLCKMKGRVWVAWGMAAILEVNLISIRRNTSPHWRFFFLLSLFMKPIHGYLSKPACPDEIKPFD